jgi:RNA polymerase sigma factor (sigma-70 family)
MTIPDWQQILHKALDGDPRAFGDLYQRYLQPKMIAVALTILNDVQEAEDRVQEVILYLFEQSRYRNIRTRSLKVFEGYLLRTTQHRCLDYLQKQKMLRFWMTDETLTHLKYAGVEHTVLEQLQTLRRHKPVGKTKFLSLVKSAIGEQLTNTLESLLLEYSRREYSYTLRLSEELFQSRPGAKIISEERYHRIQQHLEQVLAMLTDLLDDDEWELLEKKYRQGRSFRALSEESDIPLSTLQSRCKKIIDKIRQDATVYHAWQTYLDLCGRDDV